MDDSKRTASMRALVVKMFVEAGATANLSTADIKAAIDIVDDFMSTYTVTQLNNAGHLTGSATLVANLNDALPEPFKSTATVPQKALAVAYWAMTFGGVI